VTGEQLKARIMARTFEDYDESAFYINI